MFKHTNVAYAELVRLNALLKGVSNELADEMAIDMLTVLNRFDDEEGLPY